MNRVDGVGDDEIHQPSLPVNDRRLRCYEGHDADGGGDDSPSVDTLLSQL